MLYVITEGISHAISVRSSEPPSFAKIRWGVWWSLKKCYEGSGAAEPDGVQELGRKRGGIVN